MEIGCTASHESCTTSSAARKPWKPYLFEEDYSVQSWYFASIGLGFNLYLCMHSDGLQHLATVHCGPCGIIIKLYSLRVPLSMSTRIPSLILWQGVHITFRTKGGAVRQKYIRFPLHCLRGWFKSPIVILAKGKFSLEGDSGCQCRHSRPSNPGQGDVMRQKSGQFPEHGG